MFKLIKYICQLLGFLLVVNCFSCAFFSNYGVSKQPRLEKMSSIKLNLKRMNHSTFKSPDVGVLITSYDPKIVLDHYQQDYSINSSLLVHDNYKVKAHLEQYYSINSNNILMPVAIYFKVNNKQKVCKAFLKQLKNSKGRLTVVPVTFFNNLNNNGVAFNQQVPCLNDKNYSLVNSSVDNAIKLQQTKWGQYKLRCEFFDPELSVKQNSLNSYITNQTIAGIEDMNLIYSVPLLGNNTYGSRLYTPVSIKYINDICKDVIKTHNSSSSNQLVQVKAISNNSNTNLEGTVLDIFSFAKTNYKKIDNIVVLGDSLSDSGNLSNISFHFVPNNNAWYNGRFSNGPIWADYLSLYLSSNMINLAIGGAKTKDQMITQALGIIQLMIFSPYAQLNYIPFYIDFDKTIFFVTIGGNDIFDADQLPVKLAYNKLDQSVLNYELIVRKMLALGAKNIILIEVPELGKIPHYQGKKLTIKLNNYSNYYNHKILLLSDTLYKEYKNRGVKIFTYHLVNYINHNLYSLNQPISCLNLTKFNDDQKTDVDYTSHQGDYDNKCLNTIYWDDIHPNTDTHKKVAKDLYKFILTNWYLI